MTQNKSREDVTVEEILHKLAANVYQGDYCSFLKVISRVFITGDKENTESLSPEWKQLIEKYELLKKFSWRRYL